MTAIKAPVASVRISFSLSGEPAMPAGVEKRPPPRDTRPVLLILRRCPCRTTSPVLVQPLGAHTSPRAAGTEHCFALTPTLKVKKVGEVLGADCGFGWAGMRL